MQKLDISRAWRDALSMIGAHREALLVFAGIFLLLPQMLLDTLVEQPEVEGTTAAEVMAAIAAYLEAAGGWMLLVSLLAIYGSLLIYDRMLGRGARTVAESFAPALALFIPYLVANLAGNILTALGLLLFILPGLWLSAKFALVGPVMVGEGVRSPVGALQRSWAVTGANSWAILLMTIVIFVVWFVAMLAVTTVVSTLLRFAIDGEIVLILQNFLDALFGTALSLVLAGLYSAIWRQLAEPVTA